VELLLVLVLAVLVVIAVLLYRMLGRSKAAKPTSASQMVDPLASTEDRVDIRTARVGDMIDYLGQTYFVRGSLRIAEGGYTWAEHFLDDGRGRRTWLSVEEDPDLELVLWQELPGSGLTPNERDLTVQDVSYRRTEHGTARYTGEGTTGLGVSGTQGRVEYVDYDGPDGRYLSFEKFDGGEWEVGLGEQVLVTALTLYPSGERPR
jgi:hypothetical protein